MRVPKSVTVPITVGPLDQKPPVQYLSGTLVVLEPKLRLDDDKLPMEIVPTRQASQTFDTVPQKTDQMFCSFAMFWLYLKN